MSVSSIKSGKKSQAAMEFLMTYGWAILVVLAAIAALAYFGVLDPAKLLPEKCIIQPGITCVSSKVQPAKITLVLANGLGRTIIIDSIDISGCSSTITNGTLQSGGNSVKFEVGGSCSNGAAKEKFNGEIKIGYTEKDTSLTKTTYGNLNTKVEE